MKVTFDWLKQYLDFDWSQEQAADDRLLKIGQATILMA